MLIESASEAATEKGAISMNRVQVDFSRRTGVIRPLHGVNNGPRTYSFFHNTTPFFVEAGIPSVRLHDTEYP